MGCLPSETCFTLDFGNLNQNNGSSTAQLKLTNTGLVSATTAYTDLLDILYGALGNLGHFTLNPAGTPDTGLQNILAGGGDLRSLDVSFDTTGLAVNLYTGDFLLNPFGHNSGGYYGNDNLSPIHLFLEANVQSSGPQPTPEPGTLWLFGSAGLWLAGRGWRRK